MKNLLLIALSALLLVALGCGALEQSKNADATKSGSEQDTAKEGKAADKEESKSAAAIGSPTDAVKTFIEGIRAKDDARIKSALSKATLDKLDEMAKQNKQSFFDVLVGEDLEEMSKMPEMRNEKIEGDKATLEILNDKTEEWDPVPFVKEEGSWKIALFDNAPKADQ